MSVVSSSPRVRDAGRSVSLKRNVAANVLGRVATAALNFVFIPVYVHAMGVEFYGLVGIYLTLQAILPICDMGLRTTINRELAQLSEQDCDPADIPNTIRTFEVIYWAVAAAIAVVLVSAAPLIAYHWVHAQHLRSATIQHAISLMGLTIALQLPFDLYSGGLYGFRRQVAVNKATTFSGIVTSVGTVLVLLHVSPTIIAFCYCQASGALLRTGSCAYLLWRAVPAGITPRFHMAVLHKVWRFSAGLAVIALLETIQLQADKIVLSRLLPLTMFGYYTLATLISNQLIIPIWAINTAFFPAFSAQVLTRDDDALARLYHRGCQLMAVVVVSAGVVMAAYSREIMFVWQHTRAAVEHTWLVISILSIGTVCFGLMNLPSWLQIATGWTRLTMLCYTAGVIVCFPAAILLAHVYGAPGAASVWLGLNVCYLVVNVNIMHTRLLKSEKWKWYSEDVGLPALGAVVATACFRLLVPMPHARWMLALALLAVGICVMFVSALVTPLTRDWVVRTVRSRMDALTE